ncbi:MAG: PEP/pyruvate-binding domain-containing protein, partial [Candidatus Eisenbacteria bacterium]|nr:PEP/pyruvate-binding domain-containing protein [Candidatus Eisenbacteria bacterium]
MDPILRVLQERAKELDCLYRVDEVLSQTEVPLEEVLTGVLRSIPSGLQYPSLCRARIVYRDTVVVCPNFQESPWVQSAPILVDGEKVGRIDVVYTEMTVRSDGGPFLQEERKMLDNIADRIGHHIEHRKLRSAFRNLEEARGSLESRAEPWRIVLDFLRRTDNELLIRISRKMINHLGWIGVQEAVSILHDLSGQDEDEDAAVEDNRPHRRLGSEWERDITEETFRIAGQYLSNDEILACIQSWIKEDKARFLVTTIGNPDSGLDEIAEAIRRYHHIGPEAVEISPAARKGLRVSLIGHFFSEQPQFVEMAKRFLDIDDFFEIVEHLVFPPTSHGKLGGKAAGLFVASQILRKAAATVPDLGEIRVPKTWYMTSDSILDFIRYNELEDIYNHKYAEIDEVRHEYPHIVQVFKNSRFSPQMVRALSQVLDDFEQTPLIVRSSSLLEDRFGAAFSGKYKSIFLPNQGTKRERLTALMDAIAEVYASIFGPDPIEYRAERGLLDVYEEMGILIQEVVGCRVGDYYFPAFSGVAFSRNEFRWSSRIQREDGLVRLVTGLGSRAVDRLKDDYPVLLAPGQPGLRVNVTPDEIAKYSPKKMDVLNLREGTFETIEAVDVFRNHGDEVPGIHHLVSIYERDHVHPPIGRQVNLQNEKLVVTFEGLIRETPFIRQVKAILEVLHRAIGSPVDIEFASNGKQLFLLQCRPQSSGAATQPAPIPRDIPENRVLFSAKRYVSNGRVPDVTHIVYVDPEGYNEIADPDELRAVGRAVGRLNKMLPKRQFILMGPGRWGSRGDIRLGVNVTYADINNCAVLIEIARKKGNYRPDLSFGTHFFQDLVEASIRYLPLYPDDPGIRFDETFFRRSENLLTNFLPEFAHLSDVIHVIDVPQSAGGMILKVLMNADLDEAVGVLMPAQEAVGVPESPGTADHATTEQHWRWRLRFAEQIAAETDPLRFGLKGFYLIGSTKNASAGPASDIDLVLHFAGSERQRIELSTWLDGWSRCLSELNYLRTGYRTEGLLDVHFVTDEDIAARSSFAVKIGAIT